MAQAVKTDRVDGELTRFLDGLSDGRLFFFPIRHHSPACAWHLSRLVRELKPASILIEGPAAFTPLIPLILHPKSVPPFAVYTHYVDKERRIPQSESVAVDDSPARFAAYYPFCNYSPELVALRAGQEAGASLRFIDLDYPAQVIAEHRGVGKEISPRTESLMEERHLQRSAYLKALANRTGCRDHNELWDHLFEGHFRSISTEQFVRDVATYCFLARRGVTREELQADGTAAREQAMAWHIAREIDKVPAGAILVLTGGFHTVALPDLIRKGPREPKRLAPSDDSTQQVLIRYSFNQLDALNGYAAGMPSPYYYHQLWRLFDAGVADAWKQVAAYVIVKIGRLTRERNLQVALSAADEIAALEHASLIAMMRGHPGPLREDLLDGIRSSFVKGAMSAEGEVLMGIAEHVLSGTSIGEVPPEAGVPPIIADFRARAAALRLNIQDSVRKKLSLDIYRKARHRNTSRFLHCLEFLNVPFGSLTAGPDFIHGAGLDRMQEHWDYSWSPLTEGALVDVAVYGTTVEEAAITRLRKDVLKLEEAGAGRNAAAATAMLIRACRMGLHKQAPGLLEVIAKQLADDPAFESVVQAATHLLLLWQSREPLEAHNLREVPELIRAAYIRACYLAMNLAGCAAEKVEEVLYALSGLRELSTSAEELLDRELLWQSLKWLTGQVDCNPVVCGGAAGILYGEGQLSRESLSALAAGNLGGAMRDWTRKVGFLRGLLHTCREAAWQATELIAAVDELLGSWDEREFTNALPDLRLSFAGLTPREIDRVARLVASFRGARDLGNLILRDITEDELHLNQRLTQTVVEALNRDHLGSWLEG